MLSTEDLDNTKVLIDLDALYRSDGILSSALPAFEERPQQIEMASLVTDALREGRNLIVEAGTGTGKSLAYLLPMIRFAQESESAVIITTNTINLQEQLLQNDLPLVREATGWDFSVGLAKGRANYVCRRRLQETRQKRNKLFSNPEKHKELERLQEWVQKTDDGSLSDVHWDVDKEIWNKVNAKRSMCHCHEADFDDHCFYRESRDRMYQADVIVANHYLFMEDLVLRRKAGTGFFPDYGAVVVDEAHNLESVARRSFGLEISFLQCQYLCRDLFRPRNTSGTLPALEASGAESVQDAMKQVNHVREMSDHFFDQVRTWHRKRSDSGETVRVRSSGFVNDPLSPALERLHDHLRELVMEVNLTDEEEKELNALAKRTEDLHTGLRFFLNQDGDEHVYWIESSDYRDNATLKASRINPAPVLRKQLFEPLHASILTSATLATGENEPFSYITERLGVSEPRTRKLGHPFDYGTQARLRIPKDMPHPGREENKYVEGVVDYTRTYLKETSGNAFVLFTSYRMMGKVVDRLEAELERAGLRTLVQGRSRSRKQMLNLFQQDDPAVIFGVSSFWEGVDVPGENLRNVIITRLPFPNPANPIVEAFQEHLEDAGENPFSRFFIPEAVLKLRQGFGRLIRSRTDEGQVAILDSRILNKSYGDAFLDALPDTEVQLDKRDKEAAGYDEFTSKEK